MIDFAAMCAELLVAGRAPTVKVNGNGWAASWNRINWEDKPENWNIDSGWSEWDINRGYAFLKATLRAHQALSMERMP